MGQQNPSKDECDLIADQLRRLSLEIEERDGKTNLTWSLARGLEDRIGSYQHLPNDMQAAKELLNKHAA